jgi:hypothetical protein
VHNQKVCKSEAQTYNRVWPIYIPSRVDSVPLSAREGFFVIVFWRRIDLSIALGLCDMVCQKTAAKALLYK